MDTKEEHDKAYEFTVKVDKLFEEYSKEVDSSMLFGLLEAIKFRFMMKEYEEANKDIKDIEDDLTKAIDKIFGKTKDE